MPSTGLVPNVGEAKMLQGVVNASDPENLMLRLYKNDVTPDSTMTLADYTEATFTGYTPVTLSSSGWEVLGSDAYIARYTLSASFTCSATTSENLYGFYVTEVNSSTLMWSERFDEAPKPISFIGDAITATPAIILTRTGTALDVLTGLVASWPLTESTGTRRDIIGGYDFLPYYEEWVTSASATSSGPTGTAARFTQGHTVLTDMVFSGTSGSNTVITSAAGGLPVYTAGQHFAVFEHSVSGCNGMYVTTGSPTAFSISCTKQTWNSEVPSDSPSEAAKTRNVSFLYRGDRTTNGLGTQFAIGAWGQINLDGTFGISVTHWLKVRTGAVVGKLYFYNGAVFVSNIALSDANSTVLTISFSVTNDAGGSTQAGTVLPALDQWCFVTCIYDPATGKASISVNGGTPVLGSAIVGGHPQIGAGYDAGVFFVGGSPTSSLPGYGHCDMSQVNLWNKVVTQTEIEYLMTKRPL